MRHNISDLCKILNYSFTDEELLRTALTHRSVKGQNNERLEFLGDSILNFVVAAELFERYPQAQEGDLSRIRASLVNKDTLAKVGQQLGLSNFLILGSGELKSGGSRRKSILADAVEAIFGAVFLDDGFDASRRLILQVYRQWFDNPVDASLLKDPKTRLQEYQQSRKKALPVYELINVTGKPHAQTFKVECRVDGLEESTIGSGTSRREAEQQAAEMALVLMDQGETLSAEA